MRTLSSVLRQFAVVEHVEDREPAGLETLAQFILDVQRYAA
jgi:hypothetical protein